jgi:hypothetical protein
MTFAQRRNRLTTHFSERNPVVKRRMKCARALVCVCVCIHRHIYIRIYTYIYFFMYLFVGFKVPHFKTSGWSTHPQHVVRVYDKKQMKLCSGSRRYVYNFLYQPSAAILTADTTLVEECAFTAILCRRRQQNLLRSSCKVPNISQILFKFGFSPPIFIKVPISIVTEILTMRVAPIRTDEWTDLTKLIGLSGLW